MRLVRYLDLQCKVLNEYKSGKIDDVISLFNLHKELLKGNFTSNSFEITS